MASMLYQDEIVEAIRTAVTGERDTDLPTGGFGFSTPAAIAKRDRAIEKAMNIFRRRLIRFLGEMSEEWDVPELLAALEDDREPEVADEDLNFGGSNV